MFLHAGQNWKINSNKKSEGTFFFRAKQVHLESCVKPTVTKLVQSVWQPKQAVRPTEQGHRSTVATDMQHIHYLTTLGTFDAAVKAFQCGVNEDSASVPPTGTILSLILAGSWWIHQTRSTGTDHVQSDPKKKWHVMKKCITLRCIVNLYHMSINHNTDGLYYLIMLSSMTESA